MSTGAFLKIFDFQTPADKEGKLLYEAAITTTMQTIGRDQMGLSDPTISSKAMQCYVDDSNNIIATGNNKGASAGKPWKLNGSEDLVEPNITVTPGSQKTLVHSPNKFVARTMHYVFTNNNKPPIQQEVQTVTKSDKPPIQDKVQTIAKSDKPPMQVDVQTMEISQKILATDVLKVRTQQVQFENTQKNILQDIAELKTIAVKAPKILQNQGIFRQDLVNVRTKQQSDSGKIEKMLVDITAVDIYCKSLAEDTQDYKIQFNRTLNTLRARVEQLEEQNHKLQKSQDDILAIVKSLQEQNETLVQMMQVKKAPAPAEPDKGDTFDSIPDIKTPVTEDSGVSHSASDEIIDETEDEDDEPGPKTLQTLQNDQPEDDETQPDDDEFGPQTQVYDKNGYDNQTLQTLQNDQPEDPEKDSNADIVNGTMEFEHAAPESEQDIHENQLAYMDTMDNQTLIAKQTMDPVDDDEVVMKAPKEVTDDEMKEIVDTVIYKHLDTIGSKYNLETTKTLLKVVNTKLNEDNIKFDVDEDEIKPKIKNAFNAWAMNYINKKRPMDDSDPKSEQSDAKKPKYDTNQQMEDADSVFKPAQITFLKKLDKKVRQSPMSMIRNDPEKKVLLASWAYDASLTLFNENGKNAHINTVYAYIMDNYWEDAKKNPELDLTSYEEKANDWNNKYKSERDQKKKK